MNPTAILCLQLLRELIANKDYIFGRGYVLGLINGASGQFAPWELAYLNNISEQIVWQGNAA